MSGLYQYMLIGFSVLITLGAIARVIFGEGTILERLDETTLLYLSVAGGVLLLKEVKKFTFGDYSVEFDKIRNIAEEAKQAAEIAEDAVRINTLSNKYSGTALDTLGNEIRPGNVHDDPWKGQFGESNIANYKKLTAVVEAIGGSSEWFSVNITVESLLPAKYPLEGEVRLFLHPTFINDKPIVPVGPDGKATLRLKAWGAFTVGALADNGNTTLELDLALLESAPELFRKR